MKIDKIILFLILIIAIVLRVYKLNEFPSNLLPDEAAWGYNAYSILETGRDEYGKWMPLVFKSFGDYKAGVYVYLTVPFVAILGLNEWSVRLPSALMGVLAVWIVYEITRLFVKFQTDKFKWLPYFTAVTLALSPWHIQFSRMAWELNVSLTFLLAGIYFFLRRNLLLTSLFFGLTLWTYQGAKVTTSLVLIALLIAYGKTFVSKFKLKTWILSSLIFLVFIGPSAFSLFTGDTGGRLRVLSIFSYHQPDEYIQRQILDPTEITKESWGYQLFYGQWLVYIRMILGRYFHYFSAKFLVFAGDWAHPNLSPPFMGVIYWSDLIALIGGLIYIVRRLADTKVAHTDFFKFILIWLLLAPLSAALTLDEVNSSRAINMVIPLIFLIGVGWWQIIRLMNLQRVSVKWIGLLILLAFQLFQVIYYLDSYYVLLPMSTAQMSQGYGYKQVVEATKLARMTGKRVMVSQSYDQPYIYWLFYEKYDPAVYQKQARLRENSYGDVGLIDQVDANLKFGMINWSVDQYRVGSVFVGNPVTTIHPEESSDSARFQVLAEVNYPNGQGVFRAVEVIKNTIKK